VTRLKVMTVVGTRPEIIRLSRLIAKLDSYCEHTFIHTGQNYDHELSEIFFEDLGIRAPDIFLGVAGANAAQTISNVISSIDQLLDEYKPDAFLVLGDTNSCLSAIAAKRRKVPVFHMEAGNRCFDMRVPEEINRRIVDHVSDVNLTYSSIARDCLLREGFSSDLVIKIGSPMPEVLANVESRVSYSNILERMGLRTNEFFLISVHREENIESAAAFDRLVSLLNQLAETFCIPLIVSTHPRTRKRIEVLAASFHPLVRLVRPLGFVDYIKLQISAKAVLSDSGTISEESSILNFPALNLREAQERHEAMEEGAVMLVGLSIERVIQGLTILNDQKRGGDRLLTRVNDYTATNVSDKVVRIIHSYTDYVRRVVWKQYG
jgi:UDP-N-acetylglucosamine 2-epimerase